MLQGFEDLGDRDGSHSGYRKKALLLCSLCLSPHAAGSPARLVTRHVLFPWGI